VASYVRIGLAVLLVIVFCASGAMLWVHRGTSKNNDALADALQTVRTVGAPSRVDAIQQVVQVGMAESGRSIPALVDALGDTDAAVRAEAAKSLGVLGSYAIVSRATGVSKENGDVDLITRTTSALLDALAKQEQPAVRAAAAEGLQNICATSPTAKKSGRGTQKADQASSPETASSSASVVDYKAVVAGLIAALGDRDGQVRSAAAAGLSAAGPKVSSAPPQPLMAALEDKFATARAATARALASFSQGLDPVIPSLIRLAEHDEPSVHEACAMALGQIQKSAVTAATVPALIEGLRNPDREVRRRVISLLGRFEWEARQAIPALIQVAKEPVDSDQVTVGGSRAATTVYVGPAHDAIRLLGKIAPRTPSAGDVIAALAEIARAGPPQRRNSAADALTEFGPQAAAVIPDLTRMLKESDTTAKDIDGAVAAEALGRIAPGTASADAVVSSLRAALHSKDRSTRSAAIQALGQFGPKAQNAIPDIQVHEKDPDKNVRKAATETLQSLTHH
jgi:HEAT repeat protein